MYDNGLFLYTRKIVTSAITTNNKENPYPEAYMSCPVKPRAGIKTIKEIRKSIYSSPIKS